MRIAITYDEGQIFQHFGRTSHFKLFDVDHQVVKSSEVVDTAGHGHGALADFLKGLKVDLVICGNIGPGAQETLNNVGIDFYGGVTGSVDKAAEDFLAGQLVYNPNVCCSDHDHGHGQGHSCASHQQDDRSGGGCHE